MSAAWNPAPSDSVGHCTVHPDMRRFHTGDKTCIPDRSWYGMYWSWIKNKRPLRNQQFINPSDHRYTMRKLNTLQYTMFMVAALAVLVAVPSAYAVTVNVNPGCPDGDPNTPACDDGDTYPTIQSAIGNADPTDTISISAGSYDEGTITVNKALTIEPAANQKVILSGTSKIDVNSDDVTIQGITFKNTTSVYAITIGKTASDVTIHNNTFTDTRGHGILTADRNDILIRNLNVTDNVFKNIGTFYADGLTLDQKASKLYTAMVFSNHRSNLGGLQDSRITGNTIDTATFAGINLAGTRDILVQNNTISNVPAFAIQLALGASRIQILDNDIRNANNALEYLNGVPEDVTEGAVLLWAKDSSHVTVSNNTITGGNNGIVYCTGACGVTTNQLGNAQDPILIVDTTTKTDSTNTFTRNTFDSVGGRYIINQAFGPMVATHNYYGTAAPDFTAILSGDVHYNPYYNDPELQVLVDKTGTVQKSIADLDVSDVCSISLGTYIMDFDDAKYGATSSIVPNQIKNAGNQDLGGIKFTSTGWQKPDGSALSGAVSKVGTDVTSSASYSTIPTDSAGINFPAANFTGSNALPGSGSPDPALVGFVLDLSRVATGADVTITESVTYSATCS